MRLVDELRRRCRCEATPFSVIFNETIVGIPEEVAMNFSLETMSHRMNRWRLEERPPAPTSLINFAEQLASPQFEVLSKSLTDGSPFYKAIIDNESIIFISETCLPSLRAENVVLNIDATFKAVPNVPQAKQMLTIMAPINGVALPVVYVVMQRKTTEAYTSVFQYLLHHYPNIRPSAVIVDFEQALQNSIQLTFGQNVRIVGCWFHYAQAILRYQRRHIPPAILNSNPRYKEIVDMAKALALLPAEDIPAGIDYLFRYSNDGQGIRPFLNYLRSYWQPKSNVLSVFRQPRRTNNEIEAYHRHVLRHMGGGTRGGARPHPWVFMNGLQLLERGFANKYAGLSSGLSGWPRRRTYLRNDEAINRAMEGHIIGNVASIERFVRYMRHRSPVQTEQNNEIEEEFEIEEIEMFLDWEDDVIGDAGHIPTENINVQVGENPNEDPDDPDPVDIEAGPAVIEEPPVPIMVPQPQVSVVIAEPPAPAIVPVPPALVVSPESPALAVPIAAQSTEMVVNYHNDAERTIQELRAQINCLICLTERRTYAPTSCRHLSACEACVYQLMYSGDQNLNRCPVCRQQLHTMEDWTQIFF